MSARNSTFNCDYHAETSGGVQLAVLNVFTRGEDAIHRHRASEMTFKRGDISPPESVWTIWGVFDLTREGRGDNAAFLNLQYQEVPR
jgi:predicted dithiol-disulfide oxidoreductase (DUF899 family)